MGDLRKTLSLPEREGFVILFSGQADIDGMKDRLVNERESAPVRPRLLFIVCFFSFFRGIQSFLEGLQALIILIDPIHSELRETLLDKTIFTPDQLTTLLIYQLAFSLFLIFCSYFLLIRAREPFRKILKGTLMLDVFLSLAILVYFRNLGYRPPDAQQFYLEVVWLLFEILLIICLSHPILVDLTRRGSDSRSGEEHSK